MIINLNQTLHAVNLTCDSDWIYVSPGRYVVGRKVQINMAVVLVVLRDFFSHCQYARAGRVVQVVTFHNVDGSIACKQCKGTFRRAIPSQPLKPLGKGHIPHTLNTAGGSAVERESVVGSHIGETSGVGSESQGYGWNCPKKRILHA